MLPPREEPTLTEAQYRMFSRMLREHCGLHFGPESRFLLEKRLARRLRALEIESFAAYHYLLRDGRAGDGELVQLIDELTTNETYFFRERGQLEALVGEIIPQLRMRRDGPVQIWSAGCASGEEPYTLVMMALEAGLEPGRDLRVYGSDISTRALRKARKGEYREASFRETPASLRERYFSEKDGLWRVSDQVKRHADLIHLNLCDRSKIALLGNLDVVLCRNVLIYFDPESKRRVIQTFWEKLRPGGYLLLGHSETLLNVSTSFELKHHRSALVYARPPHGEAPDPWHRAAARALGEPPEEEGS